MTVTTYVRTSRSHETCPSCGYTAATANHDRGVVHCPKCHRTQQWPPPVPVVEQITGSLIALIEEEIGDIIAERLPASFSIRYGGDVYTISVTRAKLTSA